MALTTHAGTRGTLDSELASSRAAGAELRLHHLLDAAARCRRRCSRRCSASSADAGRTLQLASITIDPDNDTPEQLRRFAGGFRTGPGWQFYTGRFDDLLRVQKHFDVYRGSKASHPPVLLMRRSARAPWLRVEGFPERPSWWR